MIRRQLVPALLMTVAMTILVGLVYPLAVMAVGQTVFPRQADGSLVSSGGAVVGSSLLGQNFSDPSHFWPRPSAAGADGYDGLASAASNFGPSNQDFIDTVARRVEAYRAANGLADDVAVPVDAVTASASGLDPGISVANARLQAPRVAKARGLTVAEVMAAVDRHTQDRPWGFLGEKVVNVLAVNMDLDTAT